MNCAKLRYSKQCCARCLTSYLISQTASNTGIDYLWCIPSQIFNLEESYSKLDLWLETQATTSTTRQLRLS